MPEELVVIEWPQLMVPEITPAWGSPRFMGAETTMSGDNLVSGATHVPVAPHEARWPSSLVLLAAVLLHSTLPHRLTAGPVWLLPLIEIVLLVPLTISVPRRHSEEEGWQRAGAILLIGVINAANFISLGLVIKFLLEGGRGTGGELVVEAMKIWLINVVVFGLWYWELDRGGPGRRRGPRPVHPDFLFPQMATRGIAPANWLPSPLDYLYVSFTNSTAFSPTDTLPLTPWAKMLMLAQSLASLLTVAVVAGRAINILA